jgi:hypothetical protein
MTATVKRSVPPAFGIRMGNPVVRLLLRSPLHALLDQYFILLHVTGRKSGRQYHIPVSRIDTGGQLFVVTVARWRVNLRGGADVEVTSQGCRRPMHAVLDEDPAAVAVGYQAIIDRLGWYPARRQLGISTPSGKPPTVVELKDAASQYGWSVITLTPRKGTKRHGALSALRAGPGAEAARSASSRRRSCVIVAAAPGRPVWGPADCTEYPVIGGYSVPVR